MMFKNTENVYIYIGTKSASERTIYQLECLKVSDTSVQNSDSFSKRKNRKSYRLNVTYLLVLNNLLVYQRERRHRGSRTNSCSSSTCSDPRGRLLSLGRCAARQEKSLESGRTPSFLETISFPSLPSKRYEFLASNNDGV